MQQSQPTNTELWYSKVVYCRAKQGERAANAWKIETPQWLSGEGF